MIQCFKICCSPLSRALHQAISASLSAIAFSIGLLLLIWHSFSCWIQVQAFSFTLKTSDRFLSLALTCASDCAPSGVFFCENATEQEAGILGRFITSPHRGWLKPSSPAASIHFQRPHSFFCCCVRARRAEKWMKDVSQTEVPEMWQNVVCCNTCCARMY